MRAALRVALFLLVGCAATHVVPALSEPPIRQSREPFCLEPGWHPICLPQPVPC